MTNMNPLRYQGIVRADEDDAGLSAEDQNNKTNISCPMFKFAVSPAQVIAVTGVIMLIICTVILAITVNINTTISSMPISSESSNRIDLNSLYAKGSTTSQLQLYSSWDSRGLYFRVSADLVDNGQNFLLYEQLTSGVGVRELFCDAGSIISSDVVIFRKCSSGQLQLLIVQQGYRSDAMVMHRSFSNPIVWAFEILDVNRDGYLINLDEFSKSPIGNLHNNGIPATIASAFGQQFVYSFDKERSFVETDLSNANFYRARIHRNISYSLVNGVSPPAGLDKTITISSRIVLVVLDKYRDAEFSVYAGEHAAHFPDVEESVHFRAQKPTRQSSGQQERVAVSSATLPLQAAKYKYAPRPYHPMSGFNLISFMNESAPLLEAREEHYIVRHFLVNPTEATPDSVGLHKATDRATSAASAAPTVPTTNNSNSAPHAHIVYYVDQDTPAGIREALVEGISWWDEAFQYAGYPKNTFIVKAISREQFDPYDVTVPRRSFVEWVDRNLRSYSLGIRLEDPRSGEILKGHVRIENLRMRQDALIAEALLGPFEETEEQSTTALASASAAAHRELSLLHRLALRRATTSALGDSEGEVAASAESAFPPLKAAAAAAEAATGATSSSLVESILAAIMQRVRQLGAHEVGHTLGLAHNFAGSTYPQGYASVMDYPPPIVTVDPSGAKLILNEKSYANGIGFFDKVAIDYGYRQLDANLSWTEQKHVLGELIQTAVKSGYVYLTDQDSAVSGLDWRDTQWDSGTDPVEALRHSLQVRALAMRKIASDTVLPEHAARSRLQELFPIVYLWHRYEVQAAVKLVAGGLFQYSLKEVATAMGAKVQPVPAELQKSAFRQLLEALNPERLAISDDVSARLLPLAFGYSPDVGGTADLMSTRTGAGTFDPITAMEVGANTVISALLSAPRLERLAVQSQRNSSFPGVLSLAKGLTAYVFDFDTVLAVSSCDAGAQRLALITTQTVLVNAYLSVLEAPTTHSSLVRSLIKYHVQHLLSSQLVEVKSFVGELCANSTDPLPAGCDATACLDVSNIWLAHVEYLQGTLTTGKSFMTVSQPPLGPPI